MLPMGLVNLRMRWCYLRTSFWWWFGLIWAVVGTPFLVIGLVVWSQDQHALRGGIATTATIIQKDHDADASDRDGYFLRFRYVDAAGEEHEVEEGVPRPAWLRYRPGQRVAIEYLENQPAKSRLAENVGHDAGVIKWVFTLLGLAFAGLGWGLLVGSWVGAGRRTRLLCRGVPALGQVTGVERRLNIEINGRHPAYLTFQFTDSQGRVRSGESSLLPRAIENRWQPGDPILVLYEDDNPARNEADVHEFRADDLAALSRRRQREKP